MNHWHFCFFLVLCLQHLGVADPLLKIKVFFTFSWHVWGNCWISPSYLPLLILTLIPPRAWTIECPWTSMFIECPCRRFQGFWPPGSPPKYTSAIFYRKPAERSHMESQQHGYFSPQVLLSWKLMQKQACTFPYIKCEQAVLVFNCTMVVQHG